MNGSNGNTRKDYTDALDQLRFSGEAKARMTAKLLRAQQPAREHRTRRPLRVALVAAAACAALAATAAAVAPGIWEALHGDLGAFEPYAQTIEDASCRDQGIEIQVVSALSDDVRGWVYYTVQDLEGGRLDSQLLLDGELTASTTSPLHEDMWIGTPMDLAHDELVSYNSETSTALFVKYLWFGDDFEPVRDARFHASGITMRQGRLGDGREALADCGSVTDEVLASLPAGAADEALLSPGDVLNAPYGDEVLPEEQVVLAPGEKPIPISGNNDIRVSSMGMASDGCFHVRLEFSEGVEIQEAPFCIALPKNDADYSEAHFTILVRRVDSGLDILFPMLHGEDASQLDHLQFYGGSYTRPGAEIQGNWTTDFTFIYHESQVLDWSGEIEGHQMTRLTVSPLSITLRLRGETDITGQMDASALLRDGSVVSTEPGTGSHTNEGAISQADEDHWEIYNTWQFSEPMAVEDIISLTIQGVEIPVSGAQ